MCVASCFKGMNCELQYRSLNQGVSMLGPIELLTNKINCQLQNGQNRKFSAFAKH